MKWHKASFVLCMDISSVLKKQLDYSGPETKNTKIKISKHIFMVLGRFVHGTGFDLIKLFWHKFTHVFCKLDHFIHVTIILMSCEEM